MLIFRNIIITLLLLALAAISVVGIMVEAPQIFQYTPDRINALGRSVLTVMRPGMLLFFTWIVIFLATAFVFLVTIVRPRKRMKIEVQMGGGRVVIMDAAIKKYIKNALAELGEVTVKKIDLREHRNLVTTDITADVRTRENLPTLERRIISRVRTALAEDLGITNLGDVHVFIRNFEVTGRPLTPASAPAKQPKTEPEKTPVDDLPLAEDQTESLTESPLPEPETESESAELHLVDPVDLPRSAEEPILDDDKLSRQEEWMKVDEAARPTVEKPEVIETSDSVDINKHDKKISGSDQHEDLDEPLPWGVGKPKDSDKDDEDKGPLPL